LGDIGKCKDVDVPLKLEYELSKVSTSVEMKELILEFLGILSYVLISISLMYVPLPEQPFVVSDNKSMVVPDSSMLLHGGAEFR